MENGLSVPVDITSNASVLGTVQPGQRAEFAVPHGQGVFPSIVDPDPNHRGISRADYKRILIRYACVD